MTAASTVPRPSEPRVRQIADIRQLFPGASQQIYLDIGVRGLLATPVREAIERHLDDQAAGVADKDALHDMVEDTRARFARLINAHADEVAITKNVSEALNLFGASLPWQAGDNVVLCTGLEHPNNVYLWYNLRDLRGIEVRDVAPVNGHVPIDAMIAVIDKRTRVVTAPHVSFSPGFIADLAALSAAARRVGALLLTDAAQSLGALPVDVAQLGVDALAAATQKNMMSVYGTGFLYVRRDVAEQLIPIHLARYGVDLGRAHETAVGSQSLKYQPAARRFDLGNYNYLGATAAGASLRLIESVGIENIATHVCALAARLANGLLDLGLPVAGGRPGPHLAHLVAVGTSGGGSHDTADDPATNALYQRLTKHGVRLSIRRGVLRFGIGMYNNEADIASVIDIARTQ
ncbi:MAG: aminotransferase class V-fold PLP-dependent enzyme [Gemmatimonadota bacterium]